jgi:N-acetylmuramate 1-kinase
LRCENILKHYGPKAQIKKILGDASSRSYIRFEIDGQSLMACFDSSFSHNVTKHPTLQSLEILDLCKVKTNRLVKTFEEDHFYVIEDLGDTLFSQYMAKNRADHSIKDLFFKKVISICHKIHHSSVDEDLFHKRTFNEEKVFFESDLATQFFVNKFLKITDDKPIKAFIDYINKAFLSEKRYLQHRDFHSKNIMVKDHDLWVIDFQDCRTGPLYYDIVSFIYDPYINWDNDDKRSLKQSFDLKMNIKNVDKSSFYIVALQRVYKILGSFCYLFYDKNKETYLRYVSVSFDNLLAITDQLSVYLPKEAKTLSIEFKATLEEAYYGN